MKQKKSKLQYLLTGVGDFLKITLESFLKRNKKKLQFTFIIMLCVQTMALHAQQVSPCISGLLNTCNSIGVIGDPYIENSCIAGIQRQIARSVNAEGIIKWNTPFICWDMTNPTPAATDQVNCYPPYAACVSRYCPAKYCDMIKTFVNIKASLIVRAASLSDGLDFYNAAKQFIIDINAVYDCAGIRRPVVQGCIFEAYPDHGTFPIPADVICAFKNQLLQSGNTYYFDQNGNCRTDLNFNITNIVLGPAFGTLKNCPDITRIEAKMWFYYLAKTYIDMGYKSIHMGQMQDWATLDIHETNTYAIIDMIRQYAASKNTFVLLTEENYKSKKRIGTQTYLFDYDSRALRPREVTNPPVCGDFIKNSNGHGINTPLNNYLVSTPCSAEQYPAVVDPAVVNQGVYTPLPPGSTGSLYPPGSGGFSPLYGCYMPFQPYNTYFDFGLGVHLAHFPLGTASPSTYCSGDDGTWGWDDTRWFATEMSPSCREFWMKDAISRLRTFHNGFGFMTAPGLLDIKYTLDPAPPPYPEDGSYMMTDEPNVENTVKTQWTPNNNAVPTIWGVCSSNLFHIGSFQYTFMVTNPDYSTVYTWHIQNPNGSWQPFTYGTSRVFNPTSSGTYRVYLRQDNLGNYPSSVLPYYGIKTDAYSVRLFAHCYQGMLFKTTDDSTYTNDTVGYVSYDTLSDLTDYNDYIANNMQYQLYNDTASNDTDSLTNKQVTILNVNNPGTKNDNNIKVYPNPTHDKLFIEDDGNGTPSIVTIFDVMGRKQFQKYNIKLNAQRLSIDVSKWVNGIYIIRVSNDNVPDRYFKFTKY